MLHPPLAVGEVIPRLGLVIAGFEVRRVRAARDVDDGPQVVGLEALDLLPRAQFGVAVLRVDGDVGMAGLVVHPQLDHLPVALVRPGAERQLVVVVEVPQPVLQPDAPVDLDRVPVGDVVELRALGAQLAVLLAVVLAFRADDVAVVDRAAVAVLLLREERERELRIAARAGDDGAVVSLGALAPQLVAGIHHELLGAVGEELFVGVVAQDRLKALEEVVHRPLSRALAPTVVKLVEPAHTATTAGPSTRIGSASCRRSVK